MATRRGCGRIAAVALCLAGCDPEVFEHSRPGVLADAHPLGDAMCSGDGASCGPSSREASADAAHSPICNPQDEDRPCDDRDICTPGSVCRAGECFGENPYNDCVVADTVIDFSDTQGGGGWWYGYWDAANDQDGSYDPDTDFLPMEYCGRYGWMPPGCDFQTDGGADRVWTLNLNSGLQHAETRTGLRLPVRRWISDVSGPARISVEHHINSGRTGDGTRAILLIDGTEIWRNDALPGETGKAVLPVTLETETLVEQLLHPLGSQGDDMTYFAIEIGP